MLCNGDCVQNVSLQDELLLGCTLSSGILTETLRHHDKQQRWNDVDPLHTTTHTASVHNPFLSMFFYFQTFGKRQLMTVFPNANSKYSVPPQDSSLADCL